MLQSPKLSSGLFRVPSPRVAYSSSSIRPETVMIDIAQSGMLIVSSDWQEDFVCLTNHSAFAKGETHTVSVSGWVHKA